MTQGLFFQAYEGHEECCYEVITRANDFLAEDEFKPGKDEHSDDDEGSSGVDEDDVTSDSASEPDSPIKVQPVR